jgi:cell division protein FtsB
VKKIGFLLLIGGFLVAAYSTALDIESVSWAMYAVASFTAATGAFLIRRHERGTAKSATVLSANRAELSDSLEKIVSNLEDMTDGHEVIETDLLRDAIDARLRDDLRRFADARETIIHLFGLQVYANLMSHFAAGERYINRVWSASADGYDAEARTYLGKAATQFRDAQAQLQAATA